MIILLKSLLHHFTPICFLGLVSFFLTLVFGYAGLDIFLICSAIIILFEYIFSFRQSKMFGPYLLMLFSPFILINYSSIGDFKIRLLCFIFFVYIFSVAVAMGAKKITFSLLNSSPVVVWMVAFLIFSFASSVLFLQGVHLSGDEPHYIMITQSIVEDGDFFLENNVEHMTYLKYLPVKTTHHGIKKKGRLLSFHMPGLSFLLIPFYFLFNLVGGLIPSQLYFRLAASAINAFFALSLFYILKMTFSGKNITGFWLMFLIIFPLIFHSIHIYPELPAAMMMMSACIFVFFSKKNYFLSGLFISFIFWFHIKYYPPVIILGLIIIFKLIKNREMKKLLHFCIFPVLSLILLLIYCKCLYGSFSPTAIFPKADYFTIPLLFKVKAFLAYFLDQRDGLLIYTPVFLLAFLGLKREVKNRNILLIICFSYIFFHAFTTIRGAYSPAGRPVMFVSWILIIFILNYYTNTLRVKSKYIYKLLAGFSIFVLIWLMYYPFFMYQPVFHGTPQVGSSILHFLGSDSINLIQFFPSFSNLLNPNHMANYLWLGVLLFIFVVYYSGLFKRPVLEKGRNIISFLLFLLFVFLICFFPHVHLRDRNRFSDEKISFFNNSKHFQYKIEPKIFKIKPGDNYNLFFDLKKCKKKKITFYFTNTDVVDIVVRNGKKLLFRSNKMKKSVFTLKLLLLKKIKVKNKIVAHIGIETKARSSKSLLFLKIL